MAPANQVAWPLLLLPGTLCDARVFGPLLDAMRKDPAMSGRSVVHCAMTGHDTVRALADDILDSAPDRFIAVGFSLGAIVALDMAMRAPDRTAGVVLIAGSARAVPTADRAMRRAAADTPPGHLVGTVLWPRSVAPDWLHDETLREMVMAMATGFPPGTLAAQIEVALSRRDQRTRLGTLPMPALILGGACDAIVQPELQCEMALAMRLATLHIVENTGHFLLLEQPDACATALTDWLASSSNLPIPIAPISVQEAS